MAKQKIKIISAGGGWVVNTRHIPALQQSGLYDVTGVISNDEPRARATAQRHRIPNWATSFDPSSGWQAEADALMIGTVPHVHHTLARQALLAGKHVLTEKPMTLDVAEGRALCDLAKQQKRVLCVVHNFQFSRAAQAFQRDVAAGRIGPIHSIYGVQLCNHKRNIPAWCDQLPLGLFYDESPHFYYLFRALSGADLRFVSGSVWPDQPPRNTPRVVSAEYRSSAGFPLFLHINFASSLTEWHVTVVGERGVADIDVWRDIYVRLPNDGVHAPRDILRTSVSGAGQHFWGVLTGGLRYLRGCHLYGNDEVVRRFHSAVTEGRAPEGITGEDGVGVIQLMHELIDKSAVVT